MEEKWTIFFGVFFSLQKIEQNFTRSSLDTTHSIIVCSSVDTTALNTSMSKFATSHDDNIPIATLVTHSSMRSVPAINAVSFTNSDHQELDQFLNRSGLGSISSMLIEGGCDSLETFAHITEEDLAELNVTSMKRRQILRKASSIQSMNGATKVVASPDANDHNHLSNRSQQ